MTTTTDQPDQPDDDTPAGVPVDPHPDDPGPTDPDPAPAAVRRPPRDQPPGTVDPSQATPEELHSERYVLGCLLTPLHVTGRDGAPEVITSPALIDVFRILTPGHFYQPRHALVAAAVLALSEDGVKGIDPAVVARHLADAGTLHKAGGVLALTAYARDVPTTTNAAWYAQQVRAGADRRAAHRLGVRVQQMAAQLDGDRLGTAIAAAHENYLADTAVWANNDLPSIGNRGSEVDALIQSWGQSAESGMTTGLHDLDEKLNVEDGALVVIAGRPGSGKSILGAQIVRHYVIERGEPALFFSMEMSATELMERDLAALAGVRLDSASGKTNLTARDAQRLIDAAEQYKLLGTQLWYDDTASVTIGHVRARYREVAQVNGVAPRIVVIDYLQLLQLPQADRQDLALAAVTRQSKLFAKEEGCVVVLLAQLNRGPEARPNGMPRPSDLRDSGAIEQDADCIILVHDVGEFVPERVGSLDLIIGKQRKGGHGIHVTVGDARAYASFRNWSLRKEPARGAGRDTTTPDTPPGGPVDLDNLPPGGPPSSDRNGDGWWQQP